ncbi:phosphotransferase family protein [Actinomadura sp. HBU206391]|uniref:phosphotransferase family protein n=1 Tax=Actinomadura sp. HBU206391 TaxID=2731692 RepID=UPI001650C674|nr:phosphotransferase family protein [Actinomadura sp. HBU206391]MBC6461314.1 phosphotransferase family protein [Actinomadura sp. HBU206391]
MTAGEVPPGVDLERLRAHLGHRFPGLAAGSLSARLVEGGKSNLTYVVTDGAVEWVLRRPPLAHVLATAHDMAREHRVMSALAGTPVPVPATYGLCEDDDVLGAPFYLMEKVEGTVFRTEEQTGALGRERARAIALDLVAVLAELHAVDPDEVGLAGFGRPEGYLERQVGRWRTQLAASRSREIDGVEELSATLAAAIPVTQRAAIVHGDYKLDNVIVGAGDTVAAVVDWEMATLGDPLSDVGLLLLYWGGFEELPERPVRPEFGFPPGEELLELYGATAGLDLSPLPWYEAFACFKLAVISEGIHFRHLQGKTVGEGFAEIGGMVEPLVARGLATLQRR